LCARAPAAAPRLLASTDGGQRFAYSQSQRDLVLEVTVAHLFQ
jgi:hypothetical protein